MTHVAAPLAGNYNGSQVTSFPFTTTSTVPVGHTLIVAIAGTNTTGQGGSFGATDSAGNTYAEVVHVERAGTAQGSLLWCKLASQLNSGGTITFTHPAAGLARVAVIGDEFDDITGFDVSASNSTGTGTAFTSGTTAAAAQNSQLVYGGVIFTSAPLDFTAGASFSTSGPEQATNGTSYQNLQTEYDYVNASGTRSATGTFATSKSWGGMVASFNTTTPAQVAYPGSDVTTSGWTKVGGTGTYASCLDETSPDDTDYVQSPNNPSSSVFEWKWQPLNTPTDPTGDSEQIRLWFVGGTSGTARVEIYEGATQRKDWGTFAISSTPTTYSLPAWTTTENNAVTDWTNLDCRVTVNAS